MRLEGRLVRCTLVAMSYRRRMYVRHAGRRRVLTVMCRRYGRRLLRVLDRDDVSWLVLNGSTPIHGVVWLLLNALRNGLLATRLLLN